MNKLLLITLLFSNSLLADSSIELVEGRVKIQIRTHQNESQGAYQLRSFLEQHGFANENGFVRTREALAPLEIYNYLYENGTYVFTIFLPASDGKFFIGFGGNGFLSFEGIAAQRLFDVVKLYASKSDLLHLEQYQWGKRNYCDRTKHGEAQYRCFISR